MSATLLRDGATADLAEAIRTETALLVQRKDDTLDQMRHRQGLIEGLVRAQEIVRDRERNPMAD